MSQENSASSSSNWSAGYPAGLGAGDERDIRARLSEFASAWNRHDAAQMASFWAPHGDLINPFGVIAQGRPRVEQLFVEEHRGSMKQSVHDINITSIRLVPGDIAIVDADCILTHMRAPDGTEMPPFRPHMFMVMGKKDGAWSILAARPYAFLAAPTPANVH